MSEFNKAFGGLAALIALILVSVFASLLGMSIDQFCNLGCVFFIFMCLFGFISDMQERQNEKAKLELMKNAQLIEKKRVENYRHSLDPEGYEHAEEFAGVLEDLMDADHESDPNLNLEETEFTEIIDEDAVEKAKSNRALFFIIIFILWTLLIGSEF
jgi:hypothetical protein